MLAGSRCLPRHFFPPKGLKMKVVSWLVCVDLPWERGGFFRFLDFYFTRAAGFLLCWVEKSLWLQNKSFARKLETERLTGSVNWRDCLFYEVS